MTVVALLVAATLLQGLLSCSLPFNFNWLKRHLLPFTCSNSVLGIVEIFFLQRYTPPLHWVTVSWMLAETFLWDSHWYPLAVGLLRRIHRNGGIPPLLTDFTDFWGGHPSRLRSCYCSVLFHLRVLFFLPKVKVFLFSSRSLTERNPFTSPWLGGEELKTLRSEEGLRKSEQQLQLWLRALQKDFCQTNCKARALISSSLLSSRILPRCHLILVNHYQNWAMPPP